MLQSLQTTALPSSLLFTEVPHVYKSHKQPPSISLGQLAHLDDAQEKIDRFCRELVQCDNGDVGLGGVLDGGGEHDGGGADPQLVRGRWWQQWWKSNKVSTRVRVRHRDSLRDLLRSAVQHKVI